MEITIRRGNHVIGDIRTSMNTESGVTVPLCLGWHSKEGDLMPEQVRLRLPRLQTSAATAHLSARQQHLCGDTATTRGWLDQREDGPGETKRGKEGGDEETD